MVTRKYIIEYRWKGYLETVETTKTKMAQLIDEMLEYGHSIVGIKRKY